MKITIVTATYNSEKFIKSNIESINNQTFQNYEHLIIDNMSKDNTLKISKQYGTKLRIISEKDSGIYDAFNKGIQKSRGDIISILSSDDFFTDKNVLKEVINIFENNDVDIVYGDLLYVARSDKTKIIRFWKSNSFIPNSFKTGWSPPHPTFFVKKKIYKKFGFYKLNYGNASDIELMYRFLQKKKLNSYYLNKILVTMRYGGKSNRNILEILKQNLTILKILNFRLNFFLILKFFICKIYNRLKQFIYIK